MKFISIIRKFMINILSILVSFSYNSRPVARGVGGSADHPLENQRSTFWNLAREIIKANNYKGLTIYLHQLLCTKPPTKWLQNLLSKGGSGGANLCLRRVAVTRVPHTPSADPPPHIRLGWLRA